VESVTPNSNFGEGESLMEKVWQRIENWLNANAPPIAAGLNPPASAGELVETERLLGVQLPADVRAAYACHNGQSFNSPWMMDCWEWLSLERIREEWNVWKGLLDSGEFTAIQNDANGIAVRKDWWNAAWIPLTYSGSGDHHCLDLAPGPKGKIGQIIEMWHDEGSRPVVANSISEWFTSFAEALENDEFVLSEEYGGLVRRDNL
jgi:cell wall assembly regulator SMI1